MPLTSQNPASHLEGLTLTLATPDTENQGDLDLWQVHEVLGNVDGKLVKESRGNVETLLNVVEGAAGSAQVLSAGHDCVVGSALTKASLEQVVHHLATAADVLLQT